MREFPARARAHVCGERVRAVPAACCLRLVNARLVDVEIVHGRPSSCAVPAAKESGQDEGGIARVQGCRVCGARGQGAYGCLLGGLDEGQAAGHGEGRQKASTCLGKLSRVRT